jgi:CrcB protein
VNTALAVMAGGAAGSLLRYLISVAIAVRWGDAFPWGTIFVNVTGSFGIGLFAGLASDDGVLLVPPLARVFVMVGVFGGFTTFSSFSLQTMNLAQDGEWLAAFGNIVLNLVLCLAAVWLGHAAASYLNHLSLR